MTGLPERPVDPDWLALREAADARARGEGAATLLPALLDHLRDRAAARAAGAGTATAVVAEVAEVAEHGLHVVDLGAGTGANARWLAPRLTGLGPAGALDAQRWTGVDHDPRLAVRAPVAVRSLRADVAALGALLAAGAVDLVTASALLDVLERPALAAVVDAVVDAGVPALFALSVTGEVLLDPPDPLDADLREAFDAHQRRGGRPGPDAPALAARAFADRGWRVTTAATPWRLGPDEPELVAEWLAGRAEAAGEWAPDRSAAAAGWLGRRVRQLGEGRLTAQVAHLDLLAVPAGPEPFGGSGRRHRGVAP